VRGVYINGVSMLPIDRHYDKSLVGLAVEAAREALDASGSTHLDALVVASAFPLFLQKQSMVASLIAEEVARGGIQVFNVENGGASGLTAIHLARSLIQSGLASNVLVVGVEKMSDYPQSVVNQTGLLQVNYEYHGIMGISLAAVYALAADMYLRKYGVSERQLAAWPVAMHENAQEVPHAQFRSKISVENVLSSDYVSKPIRVLHSHAQADGASAVLLSSVKSEATLASLESTSIVAGRLEMETLEDPLYLEAVRKAVDSVLAQAGLERSMVGLVEVTDLYSIGGPLVLESAGFVERGETLKNVGEGRYRRGDSLAVNLSGGAKARGYVEGATGVYQLAEAVAFTTGYRGYKQHSAEYSVALAVGGYGAVASCAVIKRV